MKNEFSSLKQYANSQPPSFYQKYLYWLGALTLPQMGVSQKRPPSLPSLDTFFKKFNRCAISSHRGAWQKFPENSLASIQECVKLGVEFVEIDLRTTADGVIVLFHDADLQRMAGVNKRIEDLTFKQLQTIPLRNS